MNTLHCAKVQRCLNNYFPIRQAHSYFRSLLGESTVDMLQPKLASKWIKRKWLRALSSCGFFLPYYLRSINFKSIFSCSHLNQKANEIIWFLPQGNWSNEKRLGQNSKNNFIRFLVLMRTKRFASELYWPLG